MSLFSKNKNDNIIPEISPTVPVEPAVVEPVEVVNIAPETERSIPVIEPEKTSTPVEESSEKAAAALQEDEAMLNFAISHEQELQKELASTPVVQGNAVKTPDVKTEGKRKIKKPEIEFEEEDDSSSFLGGLIKAVLAIIVVLILMGISFQLGRNSNININLPVIGTKVTPIPTATPVPAKATFFEIENLTEYAAAIPSEEIAPFTASAEEYYGYEYLAFSAENIKILYRNEYPNGFSDEKRIVLDNGQYRTEMKRDYDIKASAGTLIPRFGSFGNEGTKQLVFVDYRNNLPEKLWIVDADKMFNYGSVKLIDSLSTGYKTSFIENPNSEDAAKRYILKFVYGSTEYLYNVSKDTFITGEHDSIDVIDMTEGFELTFTETGINFSTIVKCAEDEYLGVVTGSVTQNGMNFKTSGIKYSTFAIPSQAGYSEDGIITPRPTPLTTYLTIIGKTGQRYLVPISDEVTPIDIDWANMVVNKDGTYDYVVNGEIKSIKGIDVSYFQGNIDWKQVKEAGVEFAILRMGFRDYGRETMYLDKKFKEYIQGANEAGIKVGVYFFSQAISVEEAVEEAEFVLENIADYKVEYPVVFDTEDYATVDARANNLTFELRTQIVRAFCDRIKEAGYKPMLYANSRYMLTGFDLTQLNDIDRWFAYYGTTSKFPYSFSMLQYSESGKIPGIPTNVDLDISFIDYSK